MGAFDKPEDIHLAVGDSIQVRVPKPGVPVLVAPNFRVFTTGHDRQVPLRASCSEAEKLTWVLKRLRWYSAHGSRSGRMTKASLRAFLQSIEADLAKQGEDDDLVWILQV